MRALRRWYDLLLLLLAFAAPAQPVFAATTPDPAQAAAPNYAGKVVLAEGDARIAAAGTQPRAVKAGDSVSEGDTLMTGKDGEVHINMLDTGFIALRPNTRFMIITFKADGGADDAGIFKLLAGGFRSVTGWIGKFNPRSYKITTPTATIGVRGTDHEPRYLPEGSSEGEAGTYDRVYVGESFIETAAGQASIAPNQAGFVSNNGRARPRLLAGIPVFFKPGPHEAEIAAKHLEIQKMIDQRRAERRELLRAKIGDLKAGRASTADLRQQNMEAGKQQRATAQERFAGMRAKREALRNDTKAAREMARTVLEKRKALMEDVREGKVSGKELRERRRALHEQNQAAQKALLDVQARQKALDDEADDDAEARSEATQQRLKAMQDQRKDVREKRNTVETERDAARDEVKGMQQQENKRFLDELKADRKANPAPPANQ